MRKIRRPNQGQHQGQAQAQAQASSSSSTYVPPPPRFNYKCPETNCRGYLNDDWECGACKNKICKDCMVVLPRQDPSPQDPSPQDPSPQDPSPQDPSPQDHEHQHVCKEEDKATAKLMRTNTKPCPKCGMGIYKVSGCPQMWCVQCHTAFNWDTGRIETQRVHNPHYFEWLRRQSPDGAIPRDPLDGACCDQNWDGGPMGFLGMGNNPRTLTFVVTHSISSALQNPSRYFPEDQTEERQAYATKKMLPKILDLCKNINHIADVTVPRYQEKLRQTDNRDYRIKYLAHQVTEEQFKTQIHRRHTHRAKIGEYHELLTMFSQTATDIILRIYPLVRQWRTENPQRFYIAQFETILDEIKTLIEYVNDCFKDIADAYGSKELFLTTHGQLLT
jgi:hypothetical protein